MKPRTVCACHPVVAMISSRVAPIGLRRRSRTSAFLLPSRAVGALSVARVAFAALAFYSTSGAGVWARYWICFQIRLMA